MRYAVDWDSIPYPQEMRSDEKLQRNILGEIQVRRQVLTLSFLFPKILSGKGKALLFKRLARGKEEGGRPWLRAKL